MYGDFAEIYDDLMDDFDYSEWCNYYSEIFRTYEIKPERILEIGCGSGFMTEALTKIAKNVDAFDNSPDMLTLAHKRLETYKNVRLFELDMRTFSDLKDYDAIISACDGFNYLLTEEDILSALTSCYNALKPGGILIFDMSSKYKLKEILGNNTFVYDTDDIFYCWENNYKEVEEKLYITINIFKNTGQAYKRVIEEQIQKAYEMEEVISFMKKCDFLKVTAFKPLTFEPTGGEDDRVMYIGVK